MAQETQEQNLQGQSTSNEAVDESSSKSSKGYILAFLVGGLVVMTGIIFFGMWAEVIVQKVLKGKETAQVFMKIPQRAENLIEEPEPFNEQKINISVSDDPRLTVRNGLGTWIKSDGISGLQMGQQVGVIPDASGRGVHARQVITASRPVLVANAINGLPAIRFDGTDDFLQFGNVGEDPQDMTAFVVWAKPSAGGQAFQRIFSSGAKGHDYETNGAYFVCPSPNNGIDPAPAQLTVSTVPGRDLQNFYLGRLNSNPIQMYKGDIAEVLVYSRTLSQAEQNQVSGYLKNKYKL